MAKDQTIKQQVLRIWSEAIEQDPESGGQRLLLMRMDMGKAGEHLIVVARCRTVGGEANRRLAPSPAKPISPAPANPTLRHP